MAVGVRRAVVEDEAGFPGVRLLQATVEVDRFPARQDLGLALRQVGTHRKVGAREVERLLVVHGRRERGRYQRGANAASARSTAAARDSPTGFGKTITIAAPAIW